MRQVRELQVCLADTKHTLQKEREQERQVDLNTWHENLARLLEEKARLIEEVETMQNQKDGITEALVRAHRQLKDQGRVAEEREMFKQQHNQARVLLLQRSEELMLTQEELRVARNDARVAAASRTQLAEQLQEARSTLAMSMAAQAKLREELARARSDGLAAETRHLQVQAALSAGEVRSYELAVESRALVVSMEDLEETVQQVMSMAQGMELMNRMQRWLWQSSLEECETEVEHALDQLRRYKSSAEDLAARSVASNVLVEETERRFAEKCDEMLQLRNERDGKVAELAAVRKLVESLKSELRKAMQQQ
eukprot:scaffold309329_cov30-Tisochrysis_lutea.AAC.2